MKNFKVPTLEEVAPANVKTLEGIKSALGFIPNIYSYVANSPSALNGFLAFGKVSSTLTAKEKEVINLAVSQVRNCEYCLAAHTAIAGGAGFSAEEIIEIRKNEIKFDSKLAALANMAVATATTNTIATEITEKFFEAGYTDANLVDMCLVLAEITFTNYINNISRVPVDFPAAPQI